MDDNGLSNFKISESNFFSNAPPEMTAVIKKKTFIPVLFSIFNEWYFIESSKIIKKMSTSNKTKFLEPTQRQNHRQNYRCNIDANVRALCKCDIRILSARNQSPAFNKDKYL